MTSHSAGWPSTEIFVSISSRRFLLIFFRVSFLALENRLRALKLGKYSRTQEFFAYMHLSEADSDKSTRAHITTRGVLYYFLYRCIQASQSMEYGPLIG